MIYGPFASRAHAMSEGNKQFDGKLQARGLGWGLREVQWITELGYLGCSCQARAVGCGGDAREQSVACFRMCTGRRRPLGKLITKIGAVHQNHHQRRC